MIVTPLGDINTQQIYDSANPTNTIMLGLATVMVVYLLFKDKKTTQQSKSKAKEEKDLIGLFNL